MISHRHWVLLTTLLIFVACGGGGGTATYTIGGKVSGLSGSLVVQNNGGDDLSIDGNGVFTFNTAIANGAAYAVTIKTQASAQTCYLTKGRGVVSAANVTDVAIACFNSGSPDASFGSDGLVSWYGGYGLDSGNAITLDASGRILVAGESYNGNDPDMAIWRFTADGSLDPSFDTDGVVTYDTIENTNASAMTLDADGRILVVGGSSYGVGGYADMLIWRYTVDGSLDTSFDSDGVVIYQDIPYVSPSGAALTLDADGRILVAGGRTEGLSDDYDMVIWRYQADGSLDTSFDSDGVVTYHNATEPVGASALTLDASGRILVAGRLANGSDNDMAIWRYLADGKPDADFGTSGVVTVDLGNNESATAMTLDTSGRILVVGYRSTGSDYDMLIWRYQADGSPDTGFGTNGMALYSSGGTEIGRAMRLDTSGRILVGGSSSGGMGIWRYTANGSLDPSFDSDGHVSWVDGYVRVEGFDITTDTSGRILVTGTIFNGSETGMAIWRYHP